jgi:hypothetical protein
MQEGSPLYGKIDLFLMRIFKYDPQDADITDIISNYTYDWNARESTKRMEE